MGILTGKSGNSLGKNLFCGKINILSLLKENISERENKLEL